MAKGARFGHDFLLKQVDKRKGWNKKGVKAGHGGSFNIADPIAELNKRTSSVMEPAAIQSPASAKLVDTSEIPSWLIQILETDKEVSRGVTSKKRIKLDSPYKTRLADGIRNPSELNDTRQAEHWLQVRLFYTFERYHSDVFPFIFAVPNGGYRTPKAAAMMSYEGQKKGTPDIVIAIPRGKYHGKFLEVKTERGIASSEQKRIGQIYSEMGYYTTIEKGFDACYQSFLDYMALPSFNGVSIIGETV